MSVEFCNRCQIFHPDAHLCEADGTTKCQKCDGQGYIEIVEFTCGTCHGSGKISDFAQHLKQCAERVRQVAEMEAKHTW